MNIGIVLFDQFTDLDFYLPWDLLNRVRLLNLSQDWQVFILGDQPQFKSAAGLWVQTHRPYAFAASCDALLFCSGPQTRTLIYDAGFLSQFKFDTSKTFIAGIDSGALIMAALGLLDGKPATTYPTAFQELARLGAIPQKQSFVAEEFIATASRCLSGTQLALWMIEKLIGKEIAAKIYETVRPLEEKNLG
ncbi:MAG TPA: DJ-1/PfpI family protein [Bdellovibrio sp.]|uniref:DJ-1/PfpI family protein n=1 Tax=Bdellovibrio sp. TaxID=28201 RepID=UPI002F183AF4